MRGMPRLAQALATVVVGGCVLLLAGRSVRGLPHRYPFALLPALASDVAFWLSTAVLVGCVIAVTARTSLGAVHRSLIAATGPMVVGNGRTPRPSLPLRAQSH